MRYLAAAAMICMACSQTRFHATTGEIKGHAAQLSSQGRAELAITEGGTRTVSASHRVEVTFQEREVDDLAGGGRVVRKTLSLGELVTRCDDPDRAAGQCLVDQVREPELVVGTRRQFDKGTAGQAGSAVILGGAVMFCALDCSTKVLLGIGALAILFAASVLFMH